MKNKKEETKEKIKEETKDMTYEQFEQLNLADRIKHLFEKAYKK